MAVPTASAAPRLRFAAFEFDLRSGELRKSGVRVRLAHQPQQILAILLQRGGQVVTRDELCQQLWPADTPVDFEHNLNSGVKRLRAALGDSAETPRFIETLPRRGYRFLVPVEVVNDAAAPLDSVIPQAPEPQPQVRTGRRGRRWVGALGVIALAAAVLVWWMTKSPPPAQPADPIRSLAVLPFLNLSNDPDQGYFADAMTDALITSLAQIKSLKVISRTSVMSYKDVKRPIGAIGKELQADAILEGSVLRAGDAVRITVQLIHAPTDRHLWADSYDGRFSELLALQGEVARAVAREIDATLSGPEEANLASARKIDPAAHELYLRGRHLLTRRTEPELRRALNYFEQAARREPQWGLPLAGVAQVWDALASWPGYVPPKVGYPKAKAAARQALAIDDSLAEAHTALASVHELYDWDLTAAERRYEHAIALNPNYALAHHRYGMFLGRTGRAPAALAAGQRARELDPLSVEMNLGLSGRLFGVGRTKEALAQMESAIELDRNYFDGYVHVADFYQREGAIPQAIAAAERGIVLSDRSAHAIHGLALIYVRLGDRKKAAPLIAELERHTTQRNAYDIAGLYLNMRQREPALRWLQRACEDRMPAMAFLKRAQAGRQFDIVRSDPRFQQILRCTETPPPE